MAGYAPSIDGVIVVSLTGRAPQPAPPAAGTVAHGGDVLMAGTLLRPRGGVAV